MAGHVPGGLLARVDDILDDFAQSVRSGAGHRYHLIRLRFSDVASRLGVDSADLVQRGAGTLRLVEALDLGGGFTAQGLDVLLSGETGQDLLSFVRKSLPNCGDIIVEPGRSLVQAYGSVISSVIATMPDRQVIVDASLAELP